MDTSFCLPRSEYIAGECNGLRIGDLTLKPRADAGCSWWPRLSTQWGWAPAQDPAGKFVWSELDILGPESSSELDESAPQTRLPRRIPGPVQVRPTAVMSDPDILRRLRDGLRNLGRS